MSLNQTRSQILDDDRLGHLLVKMAVPAFVAMTVTTMYNIISTIFVGHIVGPLGIAGVAIVFPIQMLCMAFGQLFGAGGASVISRAIGAGDRDRAERALGNAIICVTVLSILVMAFGLTNTDFWLRIIGASPDILPYARDYLRIILFGIFFQTIAMTLSSLVTAEGNARISMTGMILGAISNIIFDVIFVVTLRWGVKGAATGTVIAQFLSAVFLFTHYYRKQSYLKIHLYNFALDWPIIGAILSIGVSLFVMTTANSVSQIFLNRMLVAYGGGLAVSAYGIVSRLINFTAMPAASIGQGMQPILGFNYGKRRYDRVLGTLKIAIITAEVICAIMFIVVQTIPVPLARIFTSDAELINSTAYAIRLVFSTTFLVGVTICSIFGFQSLGKARQAFVITLRTLIFMLPLVLILPHFLGLTGIYLAYPVTEFLAFTLAACLLVPQIKEMRRQSAKAKAVAAALGEREVV